MGKCHRCGIRWIQSRIGSVGLCRRCAQETGADLRNTLERERDALASRPNPERVPKPELRPTIRTVTIDGVDYDVKWDGT